MTDEFVMEWLAQHGLILFLAQTIWHAAVQALPQPVARGSNFYLFFYRFAHGVALNTGLVRKPPKGSI